MLVGLDGAGGGDRTGAAQRGGDQRGGAAAAAGLSHPGDGDDAQTIIWIIIGNFFQF